MCGNQKESQCLVSMVMHEITGSKEKVGTCFCFSCPLCLIGKDRTQNLYVVFESKCYTYLNVIHIWMLHVRKCYTYVAHMSALFEILIHRADMALLRESFPHWKPPSQSGSPTHLGSWGTWADFSQYTFPGCNMCVMWQVSLRKESVKCLF